MRVIYYLIVLIKLMAPICPHFAEEAWETLGYKTEVYNEDWPKCNDFYANDCGRRVRCSLEKRSG